MSWDLLNFFGDKVAFEASGADLKGKSSALYLGLDLNQVRFPGTAGMVLGMAHRIAGYGVFSANIAGP
jgi:hypothetical protein